MENSKKHLLFVLCYFVFAVILVFIVAKFL